MLDSKYGTKTTKETDMGTATHTMKGMTCGHRVSSVKEEVGGVTGYEPAGRS